MSFKSEVLAFTAKVDRRAVAVHNKVADLAFGSIVEGSPITGAPGQPVDTGYLKGSWQNIIEGPLTRAIVTPTLYAPEIELGIRNGRLLTLRSQVGGFRSVMLTRAGWRSIVAVAVNEVVGNDL